MIETGFQLDFEPGEIIKLVKEIGYGKTVEKNDYKIRLKQEIICNEIEWKDVIFVETDEMVADFYTCPYCKNSNIISNCKYCPDCGSKIIEM